MGRSPSAAAELITSQFVGGVERVRQASEAMAALAEAGFLPHSELKTLRKIDSRLQGHPVLGTAPGIEASTGSLGQGLSIALGMALAAKLDKNGVRVFCLMGDGECQEGQVWESLPYLGILAKILPV